MDTKEKAEKSEVALREEEMLAFWQKHDIFNKSVEKESPSGDFVFYDGPPFATGLPHYGHILAGTIKDAIPRFWTMNGYRVIRKWGWDCHGLPLENIIEKRLGLATKRDIEEMGVKEFNEAARDAVLEYVDDWKRIIPRMGRWADMEDDYKTMDPSYTETVWWVFSELNRKGLVYEGFKSMHLCPRCGTTLSNFEVNQGYRDVKDIAVTVRLPLLDDDGEETDTSLLVWTTTPWTLPGNFAAAVHEDAEYVKASVKRDDREENVIVAKGRLVQLGTDDYTVLEEFKGKKLVGKHYLPPFDYYNNQDISGKENAWKIYHAPYVEIGEEGTGAVHLAPAYGDDDMGLAKEHGVPIVHHVSEDGRFEDFVTDFSGQLVKPKDDESGVSHLDADIEIVKKLKERGRLFRKENIMHSYPHCWRCETPLLNYATTSWFVRVTDIKDTLVEENNKIHWVPKHVGHSRFGKWLEGARDWAISRQRYWGAPLPIWRNEKTKEYKVIGSLEELQKYVHRSKNTYLLMRHGESESNRSGTTSTKPESINPLTEAGRKQVDDVVSSLKGKNVDCIISSPFERTKETAEMLAKELGVPKERVLYDVRLGEVDLGEIDGITNVEYRTYLEENGGWHTATPPGGESWGNVKRRVGSFLYDIDRTFSGKNILIISHNSPLRMLGVVNDGQSLIGADFDHDDEGKRYGNAEIRELPFTPLPHNDNYELDYHRPYIDDIELVDTDGTKLVRVPDVFDCWFESGSMPYGQNHYPFEHTDTFEPKEGRGYPANFIAEGLDQTRGWFYSLIVLGTALFGKTPYENVIVNGLVLAEDGKKMSKSLQNYPDPMEVAERIGVDAIRFYLLSSSIMRGEDLNFSEKEALELQRKNIGRLHNVLLMYEMYATFGEAGTDTVEAHSDSEHVLDRWIIARLNELVRDATQGFQSYELDKATRPITDFIDDLSVWYLRRSRDRLKGDDAKDKDKTLATLKHVFHTLSLVMAPSMPFYAEYLFSRVKEAGDAESVHLMNWPEEKGIDQKVLLAMSTVREEVSKALEIRAKGGIKVRQPLNTMKMNVALGDEYEALIKDEVNVKEIVIDTSVPFVELDMVISPELKAEGDVREFIRQVQDMRKKAGLEPQNRIILTVETSEEDQELLRRFQDDIIKTVGAEKIDFNHNEGEEVRVGDHIFTIALTRC